MQPSLNYPICLFVPLLLFRSLFRDRTRSAGHRTAQTQKEPCSIGKDEISADGFVGSFFRLITLDREFGSDLHGVLSDTKADQRIRTAALDHPFGDGSVRTFYVEMEPRMRIDHFPLGECSLQSEGLVHVELRGKSVVGPNRHGSQQ